MTQRTINAEDRARAVHAVFGGASGSVLEIRAAAGAGTTAAPLTAERRAELLAAAVARQDVEIEVDLLAYEQKRGERNLNCFRFQDGAMPSIGKSGVGTVYLRDHAQWSTDAVAGRVIASRTERVAEGHYKILQTVSVREPRAVERALRGLMGAVSIGARATGPVLCSVCDTEVLDSCWHWPGDVVKATGKAKDAGETDQVVEWIYTKAELKETSEVPIGAVPTAGVTTIRAALDAAITGTATPERPAVNHGQRSKSMPSTTFRAALLLALALAPTAEDDEALAAVDKLKADKAAAEAELKLAEAELAAGRVTAADSFIRDAIASGRIKPADEPLWRDLYAASPERARKRLAERAPNSATPVGAPRQREAAPAPEASAPLADQKLAAKLGADPAKVAIFAKAFGVDDPEKAVAKYAEEV